MKHNWKRLFCLVLCVVLASSLLPVPARSSEEPKILHQGTVPTTSLTWTFDAAGTLTVSGHDSMPELGDCIPIPWGPFRDDILKVVVEEGVTNIGGSAFNDCDYLKEVWLPDSVTSIDAKAFYGCWNMTTIRMPAHLVSIGYMAFYRCIALRNVDLGDSLVSISRNAFDQCYDLARLVFPATMISMEVYAFQACSGLREVWFMGEPFSGYGEVFYGNDISTVYYPEWSAAWKELANESWIPHDGSAPGGYEPATSGICGDDLTWELSDSGVLTVQGTGDMWDYSTTNEPGWRYENVNTLILSEGVTSLGAYAMLYCDDLTTVVLPQSLRRIGVSAFSGLEDLPRIDLPDGLESIGAQAFRSCSTIPSVSIPDSVTEVGDSAFMECYSLRFLSLGSSITTIGDKAFSACLALEAAVLPETLTFLGDYAFHGCDALTEIVIPDSVTSLGENAFSYCTALRSAVIGAGVTEIPSSAFANCTGLTDVTICGPITAVYSEAFENCTSLVSIGLPASLETFYEPFSGCTALEAINIDPANPWLRSIDGVVYSRDLGKLLCCPAGKSGFFVVPFPVNGIAGYAFSGCDKITGIDLANVTSIGDYAFCDCTSLTTVTLPVGLQNLGDGTFYNAGLRILHFQGDVPRCSSDALNFSSPDCYFPKDFGRWQGRDGLDIGGFFGEPTWFPVESAHVHSFSEEFVESGDCTVSDQNVYTCECGVQYAQNTGGVQEHWYSDWVLNADGTERRSCNACDKVWSRPAGFDEENHSHSFHTAAVIAPTCDRQGYTLQKCDCGEEVYSDFVAQRPHSFGTLTAIDSRKGFYVCKNCGLTQYLFTTGTCGDRAVWALDGNTLTFSGEGAVEDLNDAGIWAGASVTEVIIGAGITHIAPDAFRGCTDIARFTVAEGSQSFCAENGVLYSANRATLIRFPAARGGEIGIPGSVTELAPGAFENCTRLTGIYFAREGLVRLGSSAFRGCTGLRRITLPATVEEIGDKAFSGCAQLSFLCFEGNVPTFGALVFENTPQLLCQYSAQYSASWKRFIDQFNDWTGTLGSYYVSWQRSYHDSADDCAHTPLQLVLPACFTDGFTVLGCSFCGSTFADEFQPAAGQHSYTSVITAPTCTEAGCTVFTCAGCGDSYTDEERPALGHDFGVWYISIEATEETPGEERRDCNRCDHFETREIPKLEHIHNFLPDCEILPTCTESGYTQFRCECGQLDTTNPVAPLGHEFMDSICIRCGLSIPFADVNSGDYYFLPVLWALEEGITAGTGPDTFSPNTPCTRAQVVTFLWRAMGKPSPESRENPFTDVKPSDYFYEAVLWAAESGITSGTGAGLFSPNGSCTRGQIVTFLWRAMGKVPPVYEENPFSDVADTDYFYLPVLWAVENRITAGTAAHSFSPNAPCTRGQVVTFLYRALSQ